MFWNFSIHPWITTMTSKEKQNENLYEWISGILGRISNGYPLQRSVSNWLHCHDFDNYSLLPAKIIKWMGIFHMYSHNTWMHLKWKIFCLLNSKTTQWVINEFWRRVIIIRISTQWVVFGVKRQHYKKSLTIWIEINEIWLKIFTQKFKGKALIHSQRHLHD